ncbi:hypothetical protein BGZ49_010593 [Haplosporangium sp. Z 27]|nr:hypothetical protein BGZ49_010593 [Haplosporangium sp. Z 27]
MAKCYRCSKEQTDLKRCSKCRVATYCSRECQKEGWKAHKKQCASLASNAPEPLSTLVVKPFTKLQNKTWLHDRSETDVFKLLIDTYRMRMEDMYKFEGGAEADSVYNGSPDGSEGFKRFLKLAESRPKLLPAWWSQKKATECLEFGASDEWASLAAAVDKLDLIKHYGNDRMPMQLRMFGEQVYGTGPGGMSGVEMLRQMVESENGGGYCSTINISNLLGGR